MKTDTQPNPVTLKKTRTTIMQVAREAGVSISTVSHAFSGRRPISQEMKDQIFQVAQRYGYRPHYAAQTLASRRTMNIGILTQKPTDQFFPIHLQAIDTEVSARGYCLSVGFTGGDPSKMDYYLDNYSNGQTDGVLLLTGNISDQQILKLVNQGYPVGTPLRIIPGHEEICGVLLDISRIFRQLLDYLYSLGHREFGFLCGEPTDVMDRYAQMHTFIEEKSLTFGPEREVRDIYSVSEAEPAAYTLLKKCPEITALVCSCDVLAIGAMIGAHDLGISVPADLTITGFDDVPISQACIPRLTTVKIPISELATASVNNLLDRIEGKTVPPMVKLTPELIIRGSSGPPGKKPST